MEKTYKRINFLKAFRDMGFEFLEEEPSLLVEKVLSVDPNWIGNADFEMYGSERKFQGNYVQSKATKVPCEEGEWVVICYSKERTGEMDGRRYYGSEWHKYYLCLIDFKEENGFKIREEFEHIYDAFQYLSDNNLVENKASDTRDRYQVTAKKANIAKKVMKKYIEDEKEYTEEEALMLFAENVEVEEEIVEYLMTHDAECMNVTRKQEELFEMKWNVVHRFFETKPFGEKMDNNKLTIKRYLELIEEYKQNYIWNT